MSKINNNNNLFQEAKKYKSAEEFIENIPNNSREITFHQTGDKQAEKIYKEGFKVGLLAEKRGAVFGAGNKVNDKLYSRNKEGEAFFGQEPAKIAIDIRSLKLFDATEHGISDEIGQAVTKGDLSKLPKGYDGAIRYLSNGDVYEVVLPHKTATERIMTESQLIGIWKKANQVTD